MIVRLFFKTNPMSYAPGSNFPLLLNQCPYQGYMEGKPFTTFSHLDVVHTLVSGNVTSPSKKRTRGAYKAQWICRLQIRKIALALKRSKKV